MIKKKIGTIMLAMALTLGVTGAMTVVQNPIEAHASVYTIGTAYDDVTLGAYPGYVLTTALVGSYNSNVYKVQVALNEMAQTDGYGNMETTPDGYYGSTTAGAVREFQTIYNAKTGSNLTVDGKVGPATWSALQQCHY